MEAFAPVQTGWVMFKAVTWWTTVTKLPLIYILDTSCYVKALDVQSCFIRREHLWAVFASLPLSVLCYLYWSAGKTMQACHYYKVWVEPLHHKVGLDPHAGPVVLMLHPSHLNYVLWSGFTVSYLSLMQTPTHTPALWNECFHLPCTYVRAHTCMLYINIYVHTHTHAQSDSYC